MRRLYLLRHAKSDWSDGILEDFDRPLSERGRRDAPLIGAYLAACAASPGLVLCSSARRTVQTWDLIGRRLDGAPRCELREDLYLATPDRIIAAIRSVDEAADSMMLIGHNPGIHAAAVSLAAAGTDRLVSRMRLKYPTGALAVIDFETARWGDIGPRAGSLESFVRPKDLRGPDAAARLARGRRLAETS